jgi:hypothetical protein
MAAAPAASPAPVAEVERAQGTSPSGGPGAAPLSGADRPRSEPAGIAGAPPPTAAPAIAREPAPPASAPASQFAENDIPPPAAEATAPSDESNAERADDSVGKSNRSVERAGSGAPSMKLARGALAEGEADAAAPPADQPAPTASPAAGDRARTMDEETASLEQLQERSEASGLEDRFHATRDVDARPPQRVRVILFASDRPLRQSSASGVPAGPAATLAPAMPSAPATISPAAEATPAESAPAPDR